MEKTISEKDNINNKKTLYSKKILTRMLIENYIGTIADNIIEIGWVLCFSLLANKVLVEKITTMFGVNDAYWIVLSSIYYAIRTAGVSILPKYLVKEDKKLEIKYIKNTIYLVYILLFPAILLSFIFLKQILILLGTNNEDISYYIPYFQLSLISILFCAPWSILVPSLLKSKGDTKTAMKLDHLVAWTMIGGIFITTHIFNLSVLTAMVINMIANVLPLIWFIYKKPIKNFWKNGLEFDKKIILEYWKLVKWELIRRLSPRVSGLIGVSIIVTNNPIMLAIKYWISNLGMFLEGWVDASAGLMNINNSRNIGLGLQGKNIYKHNKYLNLISLLGILITALIIYIIVYSIGKIFLPNNIYLGLINPYIWMFISIEIISKSRYYTLLSVTRTYRNDLNGVCQLIYSITTIFLTPILLYIFLNTYNLELYGVFLSGSIVGFIQWILTEIYMRKKLGHYV